MIIISHKIIRYVKHLRKIDSKIPISKYEDGRFEALLTEHSRREQKAEEEKQTRALRKTYCLRALLP
jgi:hypothetical protein